MPGSNISTDKILTPRVKDGLRIGPLAVNLCLFCRKIPDDPGKRAADAVPEAIGETLNF
jgi:hypothetical protein